MQRRRGRVRLVVLKFRTVIMKTAAGDCKISNIATNCETLNMYKVTDGAGLKVHTDERHLYFIHYRTKPCMKVACKRRLKTDDSTKLSTSWNLIQ